MRITYRARGAKEYWTSRWSDIPADSAMDNLFSYPLKYAELTIKEKTGKILEAGCGAGRILRYYHEKQYDIVGFDYIDVAIQKLKEADCTLQAEVADITALHYPNESFKYVLAFGLYHNLEKGLDKSIEETFRILEKGGSVCASFRADNIQTKLTDWLADKKKKSSASSERFFHKRNLTKNEFEKLFKTSGFTIDAVYPVENMPILYKFRLFRSKEHKVFDENKARRDGYRLSWFGQLIQDFLMHFFPDQFCNIYVLIAHKL